VDIATHLTASEVAAGFLPTDEGETNNANILVERVGAYRLALEHRRLPQRPASHEQEAEVWAVIAGNATITTGGTISGAAAGTAGTATQAPGNVFGTMIVGGTENVMGPGDFLLIPEGVPDEITAADSTLKILVFEVTRPRATP
jgi:mannose-6-phosphate isomerase-like protein (cupin superfamily)